MITVCFQYCLFTALLPTRAEDVPVWIKFKFRQFLSGLIFLYCHFSITISDAFLTPKLHVSCHINVIYYYRHHHVFITLCKMLPQHFWNSQSDWHILMMMTSVIVCLRCVAA